MFGHIESLKCVGDRVSGAFRGSAFVQYKLKESADKALSRSDGVVAGGRVASSSSSGPSSLRVLKIHDRPLVVRLAVNKEDTASSAEKKKVKKDKRNLHLVQEGRITRNSDAAEGLKQSELVKRERCDKEKHEKLRSPLFFVSPLRLAVQNLSTTGKDLTTILRRMALKAAQDGLAQKKVNLNQIAVHLRPDSEEDDMFSPDAVKIKAVSVRSILAYLLLVPRSHQSISTTHTGFT